jgi:hypothetical protein
MFRMKKSSWWKKNAGVHLIMSLISLAQLIMAVISVAINYCSYCQHSYLITCLICDLCELILMLTLSIFIPYTWLLACVHTLKRQLHLCMSWKKKDFMPFLVKVPLLENPLFSYALFVTHIKSVSMSVCKYIIWHNFKNASKYHNI